MKGQRMRAGHEVQLLEGGTEYFPALVAAIEQASLEVRMETYIFHFAAAGEQVAQALVRAASRGVAVFLVMDGIGTPRVPPEWAQRFNQAGVQWHQFSPLGRLGLLIPGRWRRMHRKLCVVDGNVAFCGGINILDDYIDPNYGQLESARLDYAVRVSGPLVADAQAALVQFWVRLQVTRQLERLQFRRARAALDMTPVAVPVRVPDGVATCGAVFEHAAASLILRDNVLNRTRIEWAYRKAIASAHHEVLIANAYFLPGTQLRRALMDAARRGVRVRLVLQGRYEYFLQFHAARQLYGELLAAGVEIHEYQAGFLHAKVAVVDGRWATVGSSNLDPLSLQLAREANVVVENRAFAHALQTRLEQVMVRSGRKMDPQAHAERPLKQRILGGFAVGLVRLMLFLTGRRY
ncbi:MAG TPA: cardiolipin synthase ClsB [Rhodoferax sp.]|nr:cardiolipin synthase ClsB [Rhodoferax sp.]HQY76446.1 cardiolipin synthase ClsB [Rhodoferax sp.]